MAKQDKYRIICYYTSGLCVVQEYVEDGLNSGVMEAHRCTAKFEEGYQEAMEWIKEQNN